MIEYNEEVYCFLDSGKDVSSCGGVVEPGEASVVAAFVCGIAVGSATCESFFQWPAAINFFFRPGNGTPAAYTLSANFRASSYFFNSTSVRPMLY